MEKPPEDVAAKLATFPADVRSDLLELRAAILRVAAADSRIGNIEESLKWGEPAYRPVKPGTGSTIRLGWRANAPDDLLLFVHCRTDLIERFRTLCGDSAKFEGRRALVLSRTFAAPPLELDACLSTALTYHLQGSRLNLLSP